MQKKKKKKRAKKLCHGTNEPEFIRTYRKAGVQLSF